MKVSIHEVVLFHVLHFFSNVQKGSLNVSIYWTISQVTQKDTAISSLFHWTLLWKYIMHIARSWTILNRWKCWSVFSTEDYLKDPFSDTFCFWKEKIALFITYLLKVTKSAWPKITLFYFQFVVKSDCLSLFILYRYNFCILFHFGRWTCNKLPRFLFPNKTYSFNCW
jgi:hypothetical protein